MLYAKAVGGLRELQTGVHSAELVLGSGMACCGTCLQLGAHLPGVSTTCRLASLCHVACSWGPSSIPGLHQDGPRSLVWASLRTTCCLLYGSSV